MTSVLVAVLMAVVVFLGVSAQMVTGMGFSLVVAPVLIALLGPGSAVVLVNVMALGINVVVLWRAGPRFVAPVVPVLMLPALVSIAVTSWVMSGVPAAPVALVAGLLTVATVLLMWRGVHSSRLAGTGGAVVVGAISGSMNVTAGVGGPAVAMYALNAGWHGRTMIASLQAYFAAVNVLSIVGGLWAHGVPGTSRVLAAGGVLGLLAGFTLGGLVADRTPPGWVRPAVLVFSGLGGAAAVARGAALF
jgi:uncharacterized membrane protein YfcA